MPTTVVLRHTFCRRPPPRQPRSGQQRARAARRRPWSLWSRCKHLEPLDGLWGVVDVEAHGPLRRHLANHPRHHPARAHPAPSAPAGSSRNVIAIRGYSAHASITGYSAHASITGYSAHASITGFSAHASIRGYSAHASITGYSTHASIALKETRRPSGGSRSVGAASEDRGSALGAGGGGRGRGARRARGADPRPSMVSQKRLLRGSTPHAKTPDLFSASFTAYPCAARSASRAPRPAPTPPNRVPRGA
jgi:hypothetical protein